MPELPASWVCTTKNQMKTLGSARVAALALLPPLLSSILAVFSSTAVAQEARGYDFCPDTNVYAYVPSPVSDPITSYDDPRLEPSNQLAQQQFEERPYSSGAFTRRLQTHLTALGLWQGETCHSLRRGNGDLGPRWPL